MSWTVRWGVDPLGYRVIVRQRIRIVRRMESESLAGEPLNVLRERARDAAIELALEYRVPLLNVREVDELF